MPHYLDTSAAVKLVVEEPESEVLRQWSSEPERVLIASDLVRTELLRAVGRRVPERLEAARLVLDAVHVATITSADYDRSATIEPSDLRTLDALHLSVALALAPLDGIVTYDDRLADAARHHGLHVVAPA